MSLIIKHRAVITGDDALTVEIDKDDFVVINARGMGTVILDAREARALRDVLNQYLDPVKEQPAESEVAS